MVNQVISSHQPTPNQWHYVAEWLTCHVFHGPGLDDYSGDMEVMAISVAEHIIQMIKEASDRVENGEHVEGCGEA